MSKIFKLSIIPKSGMLTDLDSDIIFGHFCWRMREHLGEDLLSEFLKLYTENKPVFTISSGLSERITRDKTEVFFPKPLVQTPFNEEKRDKRERIKSFNEMKRKKRRKLISQKQLNLFLLGNIEKYSDSFNEELDVPKFDNELRVNVSIDRKTMKSAEGKLFSYYPNYLISGDGFAVLVKVLDEEAFVRYECEKLLTNVFEIGYGKKKSSGFGAFEVLGFNEYNEISEYEEGTSFLSLSSYMPAAADEVLEYQYDFAIKHGRMGEQLAKTGNPFKKPLIIIKPGSCFECNVSKEFYGRITNEGEITDYFPFAKYMGFSFSLRYKG